MSLKLIPTETGSEDRGARSNSGGRGKNFNPGNKIKNKNGKRAGSLKEMCLRLVHFINRGSRFTYEQVDEVIVSMQRAVMNLQKEKQAMMKKGKKK